MKIVLLLLMLNFFLLIEGRCQTRCNTKLEYKDLHYTIKLNHSPDTIKEIVYKGYNHNIYSIEIIFNSCFGKMYFNYYKNDTLILKGNYLDAPNMEEDTIITVDTYGAENTQIENRYHPLKEGKWYYYNAQGQVIQELNFNHDTLDGEQYLYDNGGNVIANSNYKNGSIISNVSNWDNVIIDPCKW